MPYCLSSNPLNPYTIFQVTCYIKHSKKVGQIQFEAYCELGVCITSLRHGTPRTCGLKVYKLTGEIAMNALKSF